MPRGSCRVQAVQLVVRSPGHAAEGDHAVRAARRQRQPRALRRAPRALLVLDPAQRCCETSRGQVNQHGTAVGWPHARLSEYCPVPRTASIGLCNLSRLWCSACWHGLRSISCSLTNSEVNRRLTTKVLLTPVLCLRRLRRADLCRSRKSCVGACGRSGRRRSTSACPLLQLRGRALAAAAPSAAPSAASPPAMHSSLQAVPLRDVRSQCIRMCATANQAFAPTLLRSATDTADKNDAHLCLQCLTLSEHCTAAS